MINIESMFRLYDSDYIHLWIEVKDKKQAEKIKQIIIQSVRLQELIKKRILIEPFGRRHGKSFCDEVMYLKQELQFMLEESKK